MCDKIEYVPPMLANDFESKPHYLVPVSIFDDPIQVSPKCLDKSAVNLQMHDVADVDCFYTTPLATLIG